MQLISPGLMDCHDCCLRIEYMEEAEERWRDKVTKARRIYSSSRQRLEARIENDRLLQVAPIAYRP